MPRISARLCSAIPYGILSAVVGVGITRSPVGAFEIDRSVVSVSGGMVCGAPDYDLRFTLGEPATGLSSNPQYSVWSGFTAERRITVLCPEVTGIDEPAATAPSTWTIAVAPNPSTRSFRIRYSAPPSASHRLLIYDLQGRTVKMLLSSEGGNATRELLWDGRDEEGHEVSAGIYFARLEVAGMRLTQRLLMVR